MAGRACDFGDKPTNLMGEKTMAKKASARGGVNAFVKGGGGGKGKKGGGGGKKVAVK